MRGFLPGVLLVASLSSVGCAAAHREAASPRQLYFAVEMYRDGRLVGKPKLIGEAGKALKAERRQPGASLADYSITLNPMEQDEAGGGRYRIGLDLCLPEISAHSELALLNGEVRRLELGSEPGDLSVSLTLMEVDSPEFRALMNLAGERGAGQGSI